MRHIADVLLKDGKPVGEIRALCGAVMSRLSGATGPVCPVCARVNQEQGAR